MANNPKFILDLNSGQGVRLPAAHVLQYLYPIYTLKLHKRGLDFPYREEPERVAADVPAPATALHQAVANVDVWVPSVVSGQ